MEQTLVDEHINEDTLELYAMGRLAEPQVAELEEHILFCTECQEALERTDDFIRAFRVAAKRIQPEPRVEPGLWRRFAGWLQSKRETFGFTIWAPAAVTMMVAVAVMVAPTSVREPGIQNVELASLRGEAGIATVQSGSRLHLTLDTRGLPDLSVYRVELVNEAGSAIWTGSVKPSSRGLTVTTGTAVPAGQNWLRVYGGGQQPLREFGILAQ